MLRYILKSIFVKTSMDKQVQDDKVKFLNPDAGHVSGVEK